MSHPALEGMLAALPEPGEPWDAEERARWLRAFAGVLDYVHPLATKEPETISEPSERYHVAGRKRWKPTVDQAEDPRLYQGEKAVLLLRAEGLDNVSIADRLGISQATVKNRIVSAKKKLGVTAAAPAQARPVGERESVLVVGHAPDPEVGDDAEMHEGPDCPICHTSERVERSVSQPDRWWCDRCSLSFGRVPVTS